LSCGVIGNTSDSESEEFYTFCKIAQRIWRAPCRNIN